ncbi:MAG: hypothetical protein GY875_16710 [Gammaproteobacteria bacterium]|nr:hypothetical protein [Gammaproteobacteria bacterium]
MTVKYPRRRLPLFIFMLVMLSAAAHGGGDAPADAGWDQNSWRDIIAEDCRSFSDGCNTCRRGTEDSALAACTRKACAEYRKPRCLDEEVQISADARPVSKTVEYACAGGNRFSVVYHEYIQDDQRVRLTDSEVMFRDHQTHTAYQLQREISASGEKYSDASGLMFFARGDEAMVKQQQADLYRNCVVRQ